MEGRAKIRHTQYCSPSTHCRQFATALPPASGRTARGRRARATAGRRGRTRHPRGEFDRGGARRRRGRTSRGRGCGRTSRGRGCGRTSRGRGCGRTSRGRGCGRTSRGRGCGRTSRGRGCGRTSRGRGCGRTSRDGGRAGPQGSNTNERTRGTRPLVRVMRRSSTTGPATAERFRAWTATAAAARNRLRYARPRLRPAHSACAYAPAGRIRRRCSGVRAADPR